MNVLQNKLSIVFWSLLLLLLPEVALASKCPNGPADETSAGLIILIVSVLLGISDVFAFRKMARKNRGNRKKSNLLKMIGYVTGGAMVLTGIVLYFYVSSLCR